MTHGTGMTETVEQGPMVPVSEALSLPIRVTRNCAWSRCRYCMFYANGPYSIRTYDEVAVDIERLAALVGRARASGPGLQCEYGAQVPGAPPRKHDLAAPLMERHLRACIMHWIADEPRRVFLQDADPLAIPVDHLTRVLTALQRALPDVDRIAACTGTRTLLAVGGSGLSTLRSAGLTRLLVGIESGCDAVLDAMDKGCTAEEHVRACGSAMAAGFDVGCYVMIGIGGRRFSRRHIEQTARMLERIQPHRVILRTLYCNPESRLEEDRRRGEFALLEPDETVEEIRYLLHCLQPMKMKTKIESDCPTNLIPELEGDLDCHAGHFLQLCDRFLSLPPSLRDAYVVARRLAVVENLTLGLAAPAALDIFIPVADELRARGEGSLELGMRSRRYGARDSHLLPEF